MTAVEFLLRELRIEDLAKSEQLSVVLDICKQAKEIEKKQMLISDEEIEKASYDQATFAPSFIAGAKWYREQLMKNNK